MSDGSDEGKAPEDRDWEVWKASVETEERVAHSFDRSMITLSAGALGLSITFIHDIAPTPVMVGVLYVAWGGFTLSLLAMLFSLLTSQMGLRRLRETLDARMADEDSEDAGQERNRPAEVTNVLNWAAILLFIAGVLAMAWFSIENLKVTTKSGKEGVVQEKESTSMSKSPDKKRGFVSPRIPAEKAEPDGAKAFVPPKAPSQRIQPEGTFGVVSPKLPRKPAAGPKPGPGKKKGG